MKSNKAFSVIEVIAAMAILSFSITAVAGLFVTGAGAIEYKKRSGQALFIAEKRINEARSAGIESYGISEGDENGYRYKVSASRTGFDNLAKIKAEIFWVQRGTERVVELSTLLFVEDKFSGK